MKNKTTETAVFTLLGYIRNKIATALGFKHPEEIPWKMIFLNSWLKIQIAFDDLRTFLIGSKTDDALCFQRWVWLGREVEAHDAFEPSTKLPSEAWEPKYKKWFDKLVELKVQRELAWFEMMYHRNGKTQHSWNYDDMPAEDADELPEWWFDGTRAKRKHREINARKK